MKCVSILKSHVGRVGNVNLTFFAWKNDKEYMCGFEVQYGNINYLQHVLLFMEQSVHGCIIYFFFFAPECVNMGALVDGFNPLALQYVHNGRTWANFSNIYVRSASAAPELLPQ